MPLGSSRGVENGKGLLLPPRVFPLVPSAFASLQSAKLLGLVFLQGPLSALCSRRSRTLCPKGSFFVSPFPNFDYDQPDEPSKAAIVLLQPKRYQNRQEPRWKEPNASPRRLNESVSVGAFPKRPKLI